MIKSYYKRWSDNPGERDPNVITVTSLVVINCYDLAKANKSGSQRANEVEVNRRDSSNSDSESAGLLVVNRKRNNM